MIDGKAPASAPVLLTGSSGFVGGHVARALLAAGRTVRGFDIASPGPATPEGVETLSGSVTDPDAFTRAAEGCSAIIHAAGIAHLWIPSEADYRSVNLGGTENAIAAAENFGLPLVHVSSFVSLIGADVEDGQCLDENAEPGAGAMLGPYPLSKLLAENAVRAAAASGVRAVMVLPSAPVGPGDVAMTPPSIMIRDLAAGQTPALIDAILNLVDVRTLAEGIVAALAAIEQDPSLAGRRYLLTGHDLTMTDVAAMVAAISGARVPRAKVPIAVALAAARIESVVSALTGKPPKAPLTGVRLAARRVRFDPSRAEAELGYRRPPIDNALEDAIAWMREAGQLT